MILRDRPVDYSCRPVFFEESKSLYTQIFKMAIYWSVEIRTLLENLTIPTQFVALGASNAFQFQGAFPTYKDALSAPLNNIIETVQEDDLREYRKNLPHL